MISIKKFALASILLYALSITYLWAEDCGLSINTTQTNVTCFGGSDGSVSVHVFYGYGPYEFSLDGSTWQTSETFLNLTAGSYSVYVKDLGNPYYEPYGCIQEFIDAVTITQPVDLNFTPSNQVNVTICWYNSNGSVTVTASGGTAPYGIQLIGSSYSTDTQTANPATTFTNLYADSYVVNITDYSGCVKTFPGSPIIITAPPPIVINYVTSTDVTCHNQNDGTIYVNATGGTPPLLYSIDGGVSYGTTSLFSNLSAKTYDIWVKDSKGCKLEYEYPVVISNPDQIIINNVTSTNVTCFAGNDGTITVSSVSGGTPPYDYGLNGNYSLSVVNQPNPTFTNLIAGMYFVNVKDANNCEAVPYGPINLTQPPAITYQIDSLHQCGQTLGSITISDVAGGTGSTYQISVDGGYTWQTYTPPSTTIPVPAGEYNILVRDSIGCIVDYPFNPLIITFMGISAEVTVQLVCCGDSNAEITVSVVGSGTLPYTYVLDGSVYGPTNDTSHTFTGIGAGTHTAQIADGDRTCILNQDVTVQEGRCFDIGVYYENTSGCGECDGSITVSITGGDPIPPYEYSIDGGATWTDPTDNTSYTFNDICQDFYTVRVRDAYCDLGYPGNPVIINHGASGFTIDVTTTNVGPCFGDANGSITITPTPAGTYEYSIDNGVTWTAVSDYPYVATNLEPGSYNVRVRSYEGGIYCYANDYVTISQPSLISFHVFTKDACGYEPPSTGTPGTIEVLYPSGGNPPYQYSLDGITYQSSSLFSDVAPGIYTVYAKDSSGCVVAQDYVTIGNMTIAETHTNILCHGASTGELHVSVTGGTSPFTWAFSTDGGFSWTIQPETGTTFDRTGLPAGSYAVAVQNSTQSCRLWDSILITQPNSIIVITPVKTNISCHIPPGVPDGKIAIFVAGGTPDIYGQYDFYLSSDGGVTYTDYESQASHTQ